MHKPVAEYERQKLYGERAKGKVPDSSICFEGDVMKDEIMNEDQKVIAEYNSAAATNDKAVATAYKQLKEEGVMPSLELFVPPSGGDEAYMASQRELQREAAAR